MSLADAFAPAEALYQAQVMHQTWGHLEQKRDSTQKGWFVFSIADYGGYYVILGSDWGKLDDSPGLFEVMMDYVTRHGKRGVVTRLEGHVTRLKNGRYRIGGRRYVVKVKPCSQSTLHPATASAASTATTVKRHRTTKPTQKPGPKSAS